jgi:4-hydroxy-3-methylbut-2-enyl diphosphate reductase
MPVRKLLLAKPRGFCAGVDRAIDVVNLALELYPGPVYVRKEIVHNVHVVNDLRAKGAVFVDELDEVPDGATVIFSAHGVSPEVRAGATARGLKVIDATCPLVTKVHHEAIRFAREGRPIVLVGHEGHDEVVGTMGHAPEHIHLIGSAEEAETLEVSDPDRVAVITQTTLSGCPAPPLPRHRGAHPGRHLLRHPESPAGREGHGAPGPGHLGDRLQEQLEQQPPRGGRPGGRGAGVPD